MGYGFWLRLLLLRFRVESSRELRETLGLAKAREHDLTGKAWEAWLLERSRRLPKL